jgi:hypothetical protein
VLSEYRQRIVNFVFYGIDRKMSGFVEEFELRNYFMRSTLANPSCRESYAIEKTREFIEENGSNNRISLEQFADYYLNKSLATPSDAKFKSECIEQWLVNRDDSELHSENSSPRSPSRRKTTGSMNTLERSAVLPVEGRASIDNTTTANEPPTVSERLRPDPPLSLIKPGQKSPKVLRQFLRLGSSESMASMDANFTSAPSSSELDAASDDSQDTPEINSHSVSNHRSGIAICFQY